MSKPVVAGTRIKIGNVEVILRPQTVKGTISDARIRGAVAKALAHEQRGRLKRK